MKSSILWVFVEETVGGMPNEGGFCAFSRVCFWECQWKLMM